MSNKLKAITTKAKALYKTGKYSKWTDAIKDASKTLPATKSATKKKAKVGAIKKKATPKKKAATKKPTSIHKDSKSHNVKISVMSGTDQISTLNYLIKEKEKAENKLPALKLSLKTAGDKETKQHYSFWIKRYTKYIAGLKKQISEAKKYI